jgi:tetratricopeptide (TPR) repeat protein
LTTEKEQDYYVYYLYNKGLFLCRERRYQEAKDYYHEFRNYKIDDINVLNNLGDTYINLKDYNTSLDLFTKYLSGNKDPYTLNGIAICHLFLANSEDSEKHLDKADEHAIESLRVLEISDLLVFNLDIPFY